MEEWKDIEGFDGYLVSDEGNIWSNKSNSMLRPVMVNGFYVVGMHNGRKRCNRYVHRLVAQAFITPNINGRQVKIVNGDHTNVSVRNLHVTNFKSVKTGKKGSKVMIKENGLIFDSVRDCAEYVGGFPAGIYSCLNGVAFTYLGYHYQYVVE